MSRLFNIHTTWGEGAVSPEEWLKYAESHNIDSLVFIDFVPPGKWEDYKGAMENLKKDASEKGIEVLFGIELGASVLRDTPSHLLDGMDIVAVSERCFSEKDDVPALMENMLKEIVKSYPVVYWVRPGLWYKKYGNTLLGLEYYVQILKHIPEDKVILEVNRKHNVPPQYVPALLDELGFRFVVGVDADSPEDLPRRDIPLLGFTFADAEE